MCRCSITHQARSPPLTLPYLGSLYRNRYRLRQRGRSSYHLGRIKAGHRWSPKPTVSEGVINPDTVHQVGFLSSQRTRNNYTLGLVGASQVITIHKLPRVLKRCLETHLSWRIPWPHLASTVHLVLESTRWYTVVFRNVNNVVVRCLRCNSPLPWWFYCTSNRNLCKTPPNFNGILKRPLQLSVIDHQQTMNSW